MKNEAGFRWKLGMFVIIGFLLLVAAIYVVGSQKNLFNSTFRLKTVFKNVSGLKVGNNVRFSGINVGTINNIQILTDTSVIVEVIVQQEVQKFIKKDATASIGSEGLMGDKVLTIAPGSMDREPVKDNDMLVSQTPIEMDEILANIKGTAENAEVVTDQLAGIMYDINNGKGALSKLISDEKFANNLNSTMSNLETSSKDLKENMKAAKSNVLLRGYFNKKKRAQEKKQKELENKQTENKNNTDIKKEPEQQKNK